jgi:NO-binding membrane sensor protein with MHYT domain
VDSVNSTLPMAPVVVPAAPFSNQLSEQEIREQRIWDVAKGVFSLATALVFGCLALHAFEEVRSPSSFPKWCINLHSGVFLGGYSIAFASLTYQSYLKVTQPDPIQKPAAVQQAQL